MKALKLAIKKRLTDDSLYISLMGTPVGEPFQTFFFKPPEKPTFPETVLNFQGIINSPEMGRDIQSRRIVLSINVWSKNDVYEDIIERIVQLLHQNPDTNTTGFRAILLREPEDMFDEEFRVYGKNVIFDVHYGRALYE